MTDAGNNSITQLLESIRSSTASLAERQLLDKQAQEARLALFRETAVPLVERVKKLTASIPEGERYTPKPLEWFRTRLKGRNGRGAHAAELSDALRKLGYIRKRSWSDTENGFRALWHPTKD